MSRILALGALVVVGVILVTQLLADDPANSPSNPELKTPANDGPPALPLPGQPMSGSGINLDFPAFGDNSFEGNVDRSAVPYDDSMSLDGSVEQHGPVYQEGPMYDGAPEFSGPSNPGYYGDGAVQYGPAQPSYSAPSSGCACQGNASMQSGMQYGSVDGSYDSSFNGGFESSYGSSQSPYSVSGGSAYTGAYGSGSHVRHPFYSYRAPWYYRGPASQNVTIVW